MIPLSVWRVIVARIFMYVLLRLLIICNDLSLLKKVCLPAWWRQYLGDATDDFDDNDNIDSGDTGAQEQSLFKGGVSVTYMTYEINVKYAILLHTVCWRKCRNDTNYCECFFFLFVT